MNYVADIRGDLIFDGFEPQPSAPHCLNGHDLALPPNSALVAALGSASAISPEPIAQIEGWWIDAALEASTSTAMEPNTNLVPCETRDS